MTDAPSPAASPASSTAAATPASTQPPSLLAPLATSAGGLLEAAGVASSGSAVPGSSSLAREGAGPPLSTRPGAGAGLAVAPAPAARLLSSAAPSAGIAALLAPISTMSSFPGELDAGSERRVSFKSPTVAASPSGSGGGGSSSSSHLPKPTDPRRLPQAGSRESSPAQAARVEATPASAATSKVPPPPPLPPLPPPPVPAASSTGGPKISIFQRIAQLPVVATPAASMAPAPRALPASPPAAAPPAAARAPSLRPSSRPAVPRPPSPRPAPALRQSSPEAVPAPAPMPRIKLKVNAPAPAPSPSRKAAAPKRAASVLPVRDVIYDLPSDDDDDMIECEPDPDDVKPVIPTLVKKERRDDADERDEARRRSKKEKRLEEERKEERRKEARRKEKAEEKKRAREKEHTAEKDRAREKEKAREREGKRAALASWRKPSSDQSRAVENAASTSSKMSGGPPAAASKSASAMSPPPLPSQPGSSRPAVQSIFTRKSAPAPILQKRPKPPTSEAPLFLRATPGPSIDLTGDDSSPVSAPPSATLKRPAAPSSPTEDQPAAKRPALKARQSANKTTGGLGSSIFALLDSGEVEKMPRDDAAERPRDEREEKAKDRAFIVDGGSVSDNDDDESRPIRPKIYGKPNARRSPSAASDEDEGEDEMDVDSAAPRAEPSASSARSREDSVAPLPPSNMQTAVPVEVKKENDMPALDVTVVTQMYKGREVTFKKQAGFFDCTICRGYSKPHPVLFKIHVVRCAAEYEGYPSDSSSESESDEYESEPEPRAAKGKGKGKARPQQTDSDDSGSGSAGSEGEPRKNVKQEEATTNRAEKLAAKNATRKEKREAKQQRRDRKDGERQKMKKPKVRKENCVIPSSARPGGGPRPKLGKAAQADGSDDEVEHVDHKPLGGTRRQQPFARAAALTFDQEHLVVNSDISESDSDDDAVVVLVRGDVVHVRTGPDGRYSCPACDGYKCKAPGYLREHVLRCRRAIVQPGTARTAPDPVLAAATFNARSLSMAPAPPQLVRTKTIKQRNSPAPSLPSFRKKTTAPGNDGGAAGPSRLADSTAASSSRHMSYQKAVAAASMTRPSPPPDQQQQQQQQQQDDYPDNSFDAGRYSPLPDQRFSPPPYASSANRQPLPSHAGGGHGYYQQVGGYRSESDRRRASPSPPPRSPPPHGAFSLDDEPRTNHPSPGFLVHTLANLLHPVTDRPPPMALMQEIPLLLELLRRWQAVVISDARKGFENGVASAQEGQVLRQVWSAMMQASPVETRYSTWIDNSMRLWHLQYQLSHHLDRPSDFRDLVVAYFAIENRPTIWASGKSERKHIANLGTACRNLLRSVQDAYKLYKGPAHLSRKWLESANVSVASPVHLDLNHPSWETISADMLAWADSILFNYQELLEVEKHSREAAEAEGRLELEHRARLAQVGYVLP